MSKKQLNFWQIITMNFGFFGVQFSFGLQQSNMSAIYKYLGAEESELPMLWLAGPVTGLVVQPIIGAISDGTWSPRFGRRKPFFLIGEVIASLALIIAKRGLINIELEKIDYISSKLEADYYNFL